MAAMLCQWMLCNELGGRRRFVATLVRYPAKCRRLDLTPERRGEMLAPCFCFCNRWKLSAPCCTSFFPPRRS